MPSPCVDAFQDAMDNTSRVLFKSFDLKKWSKLTLIYILTGGSGGGGGGGGNYPGNGSGGHHKYGNSIGGLKQSWPDFSQSMQGQLNNLHSLKERLATNIGSFDTITLAAAVLLGIVAIALVFLLIFISSVFHFIFLESVIKNEVSIKEHFRKYSGRGLSYFLWLLGFMLVILVITGITIVLPIYGVAPLMEEIPLSVKIITIVFWVLTLILVFAVLIAINVVTRDLVLPVMMKCGVSVMEGWHLLIPRLKANPLQLLLYLLIKFGFGIAVAMISFFALLISLLVCAILFGVPALLVFLVVMTLKVTSSPALIVLGIIWLVLAMLALIFVTSAIVLPTGVFERSYNLGFLGRLEPEFALLYGKDEPEYAIAG